MQDQLVFVLDVEQLVGLGSEYDEGEQEEGLARVKQAILRVVVSNACAARVKEQRRDLPSIGFRFYSSTECFSIPSQLTGDWSELSSSSWDSVEHAITDRMDQVLLAASRSGSTLVGRKTRCASLVKVLEEVSALYSWDRPALKSPVKKGRREGEQRLGNAVFLLTRLPGDMKQLTEFLPGLGRGRKVPTVRDVSEAILSKRVREMFRGELNIALHLVDTSNSPCSEVVNLFTRALKEVRGSVIPLSVLCGTNLDRDKSNILEVGSVCGDGQPISAVLQNYQSESLVPVRQLDSQYTVSSLALGSSLKVELELSSADVLPQGLVAKGFVSRAVFSPGQTWVRSVTVWGTGPKSGHLASILIYLQSSRQCLVLQDTTNTSLLVLFHQTESCGTISLLGPVDSHMFLLLLKLGPTTRPRINLPDSLTSYLQGVDRLQFTPSKVVNRCNIEVGKFDMSTLEGWRVPDLPLSDVMENVRRVGGVWRDNKSSYYQHMLKVREAYTSNKGEKGLKFDKERRVIPSEDKDIQEHRKDVTKVALEKKLSSMSTQSTVSRASSKSSGSGVIGDNKIKPVGRGLTKVNSTFSSKSRGALLRQLGGEKARSSVDSDSSLLNNSGGQVDTAAFVKETVLANKSKASSRVTTSVGSVEDTDTLVRILVELKDEMIGQNEDDVVLAGYSEACVSLLLSHLDQAGVSKTSLEELVFSQLLLDVSGVAKQHSTCPQGRVGQHKVQVLIRAEVHWLLANQEKQAQYEDSMLAHLRQISLHGGNPVMLEFLNLVLTECYVDRQPELLCALYDELDQERPKQLAILFSPLPPHTPGLVSKTAAPSSVVMAEEVVKQQQVKSKVKVSSKSFRSRPKSFDTSLISRQIDLAAGRKGRKEGSKIITTGRMASKGGASSRARAGISVRKRFSVMPTKSPKKPSKQMVKRNLMFDDPRVKSPRKKMKSPMSLVGKSPRKLVSVTTPSKTRRRTPCKMTPGKQHRVLVPETPAVKQNKRKSDGNTSVAETPDKAGSITTPRRQKASLALHRRASFYSGNNSRNVQRFEDQFNASWLRGNSGSESSVVRRESLESGEDLGVNKSQVLFSNLLVRKRKREDSPCHDETDIKSPVRNGVKRRLPSLSDPMETSFLPITTSTMVPGSGLQPLESTCIGGNNHQQALAIVGLEMSSISSLNKTPRKNFVDTEDDLFSPSKRVQFNMAPQPPTPNRGGVAARSILKTPSKTPNKTPSKSPFLTPSSRRVHQTPNKTPRSQGTTSRRLKLLSTPQKETEDSSDQQSTVISAKTLTPSSRLTLTPSSRVTPLKSPARRDLCASAGRILPILPIGDYGRNLVKNSTPPRTTSDRTVVSSQEEDTLASTQPLKVSSTLDFAPALVSTQLPSTLSQPSYNLDNLATPTELQSVNISGTGPTSSITLLPPGKLNSDIFNSSALHPPMNNSSGMQDTFLTSTSQCQPIKPQIPDKVINQTAGMAEFQEQSPVNVDHSSKTPVKVNAISLTPNKVDFNNTTPIKLDLHNQTPVKLDSLAASGELELLSPVKRNVTQRRSLQFLDENEEESSEENQMYNYVYNVGDNIVELIPCIDDDVAISNAMGLTKDEYIDTKSTVWNRFDKKVSEHSLTASSDRGPTPEPGGPSSGYSSEPHPEPSPGYTSDHYSPGQVQVSSPAQVEVLSPTQVEVSDQPEAGKKSKTMKKQPHPQVRKLTDKLSAMFSPLHTRRKSVPRSQSVNKSVVDETVETGTEEFMINLGREGEESPPSRKRKSISRSSSGVSVELDIPPKIQVPQELGLTLVKSSSGKTMLREVAGLEDRMSPYFSAGQGKRRSGMRRERSPQVRGVNRRGGGEESKVKLSTKKKKQQRLKSNARRRQSADHIDETEVERLGTATRKPRVDDNEDLGAFDSDDFEIVFDDQRSNIEPKLNKENKKKQGRLRGLKAVKYTEDSEESLTDEDDDFEDVEEVTPREIECGQCNKIMKTKATLKSHLCLPKTRQRRGGINKKQKDSEDNIEYASNSKSGSDALIKDEDEKGEDKVFTDEEVETDKEKDYNTPRKYKRLRTSKKLSIQKQEELENRRPTNKLGKETDNDSDKYDSGRKMILIKSPARFRCSCCNKKFNTRQSRLDHLEKIQQASDKTVTEEDYSDEVQEKLGTPKLVAELQDSLSDHFTPDMRGRARKVPDRLANTYLEQVERTPRSSKVVTGGKKLFRVPSLLKEAVTTSTPNVDTPNTLRRKSERARPGGSISYADLPDFESSLESETSPELMASLPRSPSVTGIQARKRFVLASKTSSPIRKVSGSKSVEILQEAGSKSDSRMEDILQVKNLNDSQHEIQDISSALDDSPVDLVEKEEALPQMMEGRTPAKSPGKYFSVGSLTETPSGQFRIKFNRIAKPHRTGCGSARNKSPEDSSPKEDFLVTRVSRRAAQDIGISPHKLQTIMTATSPRHKGGQTTPEKENQAKSDKVGNKTPKIRIKKIGFFSPKGVKQMWKAETVYSPTKKAPVSPLKQLTQFINKSPAKNKLIAKSPAKNNFSPLSSRSIHKLTTSPIINTVPEQRHGKTKRVNKQLAYL